MFIDVLKLTNSLKFKKIGIFGIKHKPMSKTQNLIKQQFCGDTLYISLRFKKVSFFVEYQGGSIFFKGGKQGAILKIFGIETAVVKRIFSKINILEDKWLRKMAKKSGKCVFLFKEQELEKVLEFRPPLFFNFRGGNTSSTFSYSCKFKRYAILGLKFIFQNINFFFEGFPY